MFEFNFSSLNKTLQLQKEHSERIENYKTTKKNNLKKIYLDSLKEPGRKTLYKNIYELIDNEIFEDSSREVVEVGVDEVGRGPLFGRVYTASVILPSVNSDFKFEILKDSKRFTSKKKLLEVYNYIIENCVDYCCSWRDENHIDSNNIRYSTLECMSECVETLQHKHNINVVLFDGKDIPQISGCKVSKENIYSLEGGDNISCSIAAASIIAKVERDRYVEDLCKEYPALDIYYKLSQNKGYGTKHHLDGIKEHGITKWHRKTFGICKRFSSIIEV